MQVVVFRMLRETLIFFLLLAIMALGFVQSMVALDAADTELSDPWGIINILLQALLGSPDFDSTAKNFSPPFGLVIVRRPLPPPRSLLCARACVRLALD